MNLRIAGLMLLMLLCVPLASIAGDRHVLVDTNGDGQLNDCPNPAHNASGTSSSLELSVCRGGSSDGRVIGSASGRVTATTCTSGGGSLQPLTSGQSADLDGDGQSEPVYSHPQACVHNMAKSDSCEIHAGTHSNAGAVCDEDCAYGGMGGALGACDRYDCFQASVVAFGDGPNLNGTGYGTASAPGYLRAAWMNGATDTWDEDGDKNPDSPYAAILSGDHNGNGTFEGTTCADNSCSGDSFYGVIVGCGGGGGYGSAFCPTTMESGATRVTIDSDGDGTFDTEVGKKGQRNVDHLIIKDLVFTRYNGGNGASNGARAKEGILAMEGNEDGTDGLLIDHVWMHDNDYALNPSRENHWAYISDSHNHMCDNYLEIRNSFFEQNNEKLTADECGPNNECGCPKNFHDNRIVLDIKSARATPGNDRLIAINYWKSIDRAGNGTRIKQMRFWNNEIIIKNPRSSKAYFMDLQLLGNGQGTGDGELWVYGNVFRNHPQMTGKFKRFWTSFCTDQNNGTGLWKTFFFNNTFDIGVDIDQVCGDGLPGELLVERNNAYFQTYGINATTNVNQVNRLNELQTSSSSDRSTWFVNDQGLETATGLASYTPASGGPLSASGSCDPDGDGVTGVDYDFDGNNDFSWIDLAGNLVNCDQASSPIHVGAIQSSTSALGAAPVQPSISSVASVNQNGATVTASPFQDPDVGATQAGAQFQADEAGGDFGSPASDSGFQSGAVNQWTFTGMAPGTSFVSRVRYRDNVGLWSSWSDASGGAFTTAVDDVDPENVTNLRRTDLGNF